MVVIWGFRTNCKGTKPAIDREEKNSNQQTSQTLSLRSTRDGSTPIIMRLNGNSTSVAPLSSKSEGADSPKQAFFGSQFQIFIVIDLFSRHFGVFDSSSNTLLIAVGHRRIDRPVATQKSRC
eukprot:gene1651-1019_t